MGGEKSLLCAMTLADFFSVRFAFRRVENNNLESLTFHMQQFSVQYCEKKIKWQATFYQNSYSGSTFPTMGSPFQ